MSLINRIKTACWNSMVKKFTSRENRNRSTFNLDNAKTVGIVYNASEEYMIKETDDLIDYLKYRGIKTKSIGLAHYNIVPHYCIPQLSKLFICQKDLNWCWKPSRQKTEDFLNEDFDLLISLDLEQDKTLQYLAAASNAKFKAGYYHPDNIPVFDFLVKSDINQLKDYIKQLIYYLSVFNT